MRIRVIGVGNLLLGDEGVGVHAIRTLEQVGVPPRVELIDGGTAGLGLIGYLEDVDKVIFIDAADMGQSPGTFRRFQSDEVRILSAERGLSLHEIGLFNVLGLARQTGIWPPELVIFGVQPATLGHTVELSDVCAAVLPALVAAIQAEFDSI
ncbi:MAG: hydrogenase maturation protease [Acidobacteria bacterium]|nr:hydrogenase maturation protease [Acidobacteriota bacterium]